MKLFGTMQFKDNELNIGGVGTNQIKEKFKTPVYIIDNKLAKDNCKRFYKAFKCEERGNKVAYAGKAFLPIEMCKLINDQNLHLDVSSSGELYTAYRAKFPMKKVYFHGNNKNIDEIEMGVEMGVGVFVVDNIYELNNLDNICRSKDLIQNIFVRITPGIEAHTHRYIKTGCKDSKFGFPLIESDILNLIDLIKSKKNLNLIGFHCHIGSQIFSIKPYEETIEVMMALIYKVWKTKGIYIKELNLGGGFGIYYSDGDAPLSIEEYCSGILDKIDLECRKFTMDRPILTIEPGRSIIGNAGTTIYTVGAIKDIKDVKKYVLIDGGMNDNIRPALYNAKYQGFLANKEIDENYEKITVAGKCCESGDILIKDIMMSEVLEGDTIAVISTGAYCYSMANNYNKNPKCAVVMVEDGEYKLICKRESLEDIIKNEINYNND